LSLRELLAKSVEPPPNSVGVTAARLAAGLVFGSGHWHCSISGRALKDRLVLKLGAHFSLRFAPVKEVQEPESSKNWVKSQRHKRYARLCQIWRPAMNAKTKALLDQARQLSPEERIKLIEDLQSSLESIDPEIDREWAEEARDRLNAYRRGEIEAITLAEAIAGLAKR
jgi:putative addiction module component (TIGR02574 family)